MDEFGCSGLDSVQVTVAEFQDCLFIPEIVTPNGDNSNDEWVITGIQNYPNAEVSIFNRWGNLIFTVSPYENNWYGQVNKGVNVGDGSGKVPPGTYFYIVDLKDGQTEPFKGYLELQY
jgi:gliding motility-associated-like protein